MCGHDVAHRRGASREHVIPAWMQRDFKLTREKLSYTPMEADAIFAPLQLSLPNNNTPHRSHSFGSLLLGSVCKACNDGWMSALEDQARPDLSHLIRGEGQPVVDPFAVANWSLKTCFTLTLATNPPIGRVLACHGDRSITERTEMPPGVNVFLHRSAREGWWFSAVSTFDVSVAGAVGDDEAKAIAAGGHRNAYCYFLHLGRLLLVVHYWPDNRSVLRYDAARLELLCAGTKVYNEPVTLGTLDYDLLLGLVLSLRTTIDVENRQPSDFCLCGSGAPAVECTSLGHTIDLSGNSGWLS